MAAAANNIMRYLYRGEEGEFIPHEATHITVAEDAIFVRARAFIWHRKIIEVILHDNVEKIEESAFAYCISLRRVIMPGVKEVEHFAFCECKALTDVEWDKLEIIGRHAFRQCYLRSINLPSASIVNEKAFSECKLLTEVKFSSQLQRVDKGVFFRCPSLERITLPLNDFIFTYSNNDVFEACHNLVHADLVGGEMHQFIAALQLEEWRNDINEEIDLINQILPNADWVRKTVKISWWISSVITHLDYYEAEHRKLMKEATTLLELALWKANLSGNEGQVKGVPTTRGRRKRARKEIFCEMPGVDVVIKNVLPFLVTPSTGGGARREKNMVMGRLRQFL